MAYAFEDEKYVFRRLIRLGVPTLLAKMVVAFWAWFEFFNEPAVLVQKLVYVSHMHLLEVALEAELFLNYLHIDPRETSSASRINMPATQLYVGDLFEEADLLSDGRDDVISAISCTFQWLSESIFDEPYEEGRDRLRPTYDEGNRSLHMAFSEDGVPSKIQIAVFFSEYYGPDCIKELEIFKYPVSGPAERYGRIVFKSCITVAKILLGRREVHGYINGYRISLSTVGY